jgi:integrase
MGLGPLSAVSLSEARTRAEACRLLLVDKVDPIEARKRARQDQAKAAAKAITFAEACTRYISAHKTEWRNPKHRAQWAATLSTYAAPVFGRLSVADVNIGLVLRVLEPLWTEKHETASRLRGRIEKVLDWARGHGYRTGDNPAEWKGNLDALLAAGKPPVKHHAALPYADLPAFVVKLRKQEGIAARALEILILTAARTGEIVGAKWGELDLDAKEWRIPAGRMKAEREHRVPLSDRAVEILEALPRLAKNDFVFPGMRAGQPLSTATMAKVLERMGADVTVHGFRASFKTWASECTAVPREIIELSLAHSVGNAVEQAYQRSDLLERRRGLMDQWARFIGQEKSGKVTPISKHAA